MSSDRISEIRARLEKATPGPWRVDGDHPLCGEVWVITENPPPLDPDGKPWHRLASPELVVPGLDDQPGDADFIAHARADIPYLLEEVERLTAERDDSREALAELIDERDAWEDLERRLRAVIRAQVESLGPLSDELEALSARLAASEQRVAALSAAGAALVSTFDSDCDRWHAKMEQRVDALRAAQAGSRAGSTGEGE